MTNSKRSAHNPDAAAVQCKLHIPRIGSHYPLKAYIPPQKAYILKVRASPGPVPGNVRFHLDSRTRTCDSVVRHSKIKCSTSALGQKRTLNHFCPMSGLPPKADIAAFEFAQRNPRSASI